MHVSDLIMLILKFKIQKKNNFSYFKIFEKYVIVRHTYIITYKYTHTCTVLLVSNVYPKIIFYKLLC